VSSHEPPSLTREILSGTGKVVCFLSFFVLVYSVPALCQAALLTDRASETPHLRPVLTYLTMLSLMGTMGFASGILMIYQKPILAVGAFFLTLAIAAWGLPDR
jgi:hypothetical protein